MRCRRLNYSAHFVCGYDTLVLSRRKTDPGEGVMKNEKDRNELGLVVKLGTRLASPIVRTAQSPIELS